MSPDFIITFTFIVYAVGIFFAMIAALATDFYESLADDYDRPLKIIIACFFSWVLVIVILAPKILRLYKRKW